MNQKGKKMYLKGQRQKDSFRKHPKQKVLNLKQVLVKIFLISIVLSQSSRQIETRTLRGIIKEFNLQVSENYKKAEIPSPLRDSPSRHQTSTRRLQGMVTAGVNETTLQLQLRFRNLTEEEIKHTQIINIEVPFNFNMTKEYQNKTLVYKPEEMDKTEDHRMKLNLTVDPAKFKWFKMDQKLNLFLDEDIGGDSLKLISFRLNCFLNQTKNSKEFTPVLQIAEFYFKHKTQFYSISIEKSMINEQDKALDKITNFFLIGFIPTIVISNILI